MAAMRAEVLRLLAEPMRPVGHPSNTSNVSNSAEEKPSYGNTSGYALRVLADRHPALYQEVRAGRLSPHKAAVEAGSC
jgi:hypothetical protein